MAETGENRCRATSGPSASLANERTWNQGYRWLLCLAKDNLEYEQTIEWPVDDLRAFWDQQLPDVSPRPSEVRVFTDEDYDPKDPPTCGEDVLDNNAWHCPGRDYVAWDPRWFKSAFYNRYGDIAVAVVLAHEWGHVIQGRFGLFDEQRRANLSAEDQRADEVKKEYQADCFAGVWLRHYHEGGEGAVVLPPAPTATRRSMPSSTSPTRSPPRPRVRGAGARRRVAAHEQPARRGQEWHAGLPEAGTRVTNRASPLR